MLGNRTARKAVTAQLEDVFQELLQMKPREDYCYSVHEKEKNKSWSDFRGKNGTAGGGNKTDLYNGEKKKGGEVKTKKKTARNFKRGLFTHRQSPLKNQNPTKGTPSGGKDPLQRRGITQRVKHNNVHLHREPGPTKGPGN